MNITEINPYMVIKRFPSHRDVIERLHKTDPIFKTLCSDYRQCVKALEFWNSADLCEAPQRRQEYETMQKELEAEILQNLQRYGASEENKT